MKYEVHDPNSNDSEELSSDSQSSQSSSGNDFLESLSNSRMITTTSTNLSQLDGLNSGVPTKTTPTITPTTLRNIEQTFIELQCKTEQHTSQAGFVPPPININTLGVQQNVGFTGGTLRVSPGPTSSSCSIDSASSPAPPSPPNTGESSSNSSQVTPVRRRGMGGRRPNASNLNLSPEEEERRCLRRERNKMAAARCRKRRLDHTNELVDETDGLERKKQMLQAEIQKLQQDREELEFILETHRACCRLQANRRELSPPDVKPIFQSLVISDNDRNDSPLYHEQNGNIKVKVEMIEHPLGLESDVFTSPIVNKRIMLSSANPQVIPAATSQEQTSTRMTKPNRPNSLNVALHLTPAQVHNLKNNSNHLAGVDTSTPSNGIPFNFESLMDGGTGLTPVQPCATQQHKTQPEIISPDAMGNGKLVSL